MHKDENRNESWSGFTKERSTFSVGLVMFLLSMETSGGAKETFTSPQSVDVLIGGVIQANADVPGSTFPVKYHVKQDADFPIPRPFS
jgi:hypothetical protein